MNRLKWFGLVDRIYPERMPKVSAVINQREIDLEVEGGRARQEEGEE